MALIQCDWCPYKRRRNTDTQTDRKPQYWRQRLELCCHKPSNDKDCQKVRERPGMVSPSAPPEGAITDGNLTLEFCPPKLREELSVKLHSSQYFCYSSPGKLTQKGRSKTISIHTCHDLVCRKSSVIH